ncbi:uncharacterized protein [Halyomorpha halys]|uniref:uncharacterized protein n=1 Tax=Halyomorpha halys TaxID=286706 RepID=UPI0006D4ED04|nr:uncharacterized protein LOC106689064 [Halyomorpha halys]KAE8573236.1 EcKinase 33 [Halyomorpha halys]
MEKVLSSVIPSLVKKGIFGDVEFKDLKSENDKDIGAQFASTLAFANLIVKSNSGEEILPLVIKAPMPERKDNHVQFLMESLMYKEVLPTLGFDQVCYPKIHYNCISLENPEENILIFENVKYKHYCNTKIRTFLDFDHISLALKTLARFHSLSFILKHDNLEKFLELTEKMKKYCFDPETYSVYNIPLYAAIERGFRGFEKEIGPNETLEDALRALKNPTLLRGKLSLPEEPFDVICHGDFCNNNLMYKYNEKGSPSKCILYDFQLSIYGNIAVELAFFLYMHTNSECREKYWDSFLRIYWDSLKESVPNHIELPKYEDFLEYFEARAMLGYLISSFFLPMVMDPDVQFWGNLPLEEQIALMKTIAGNEGEKALVDVVSHMYKKKYIHKFLNYMKTKKYLV